MSLSTFQAPLPGSSHRRSPLPSPEREEGGCRGKKTKERKTRGPANQKVHIDRFERSDVLIQKSEGYILEAPKAAKEDFAGPRMDTIFKGLAEAKQKEENFKKRQELKELERIIAEREGGQATKRMWAGEESEARRKIRDRTGWSWSSGVEDLRGGQHRGPVLDFSREIKMPSVEMKAGVPMLGGVGAKMMAKMGWKEGEGLGKDSGLPVV